MWGGGRLISFEIDCFDGQLASPIIMKFAMPLNLPIELIQFASPTPKLFNNSPIMKQIPKIEILVYSIFKQNKKTAESVIFCF